MDVSTNINASPISEAALERATQLAVGNAIASAFAEDPVIGADLSRAISVLGSVVKRHGLLLQKTLADGFGRQRPIRCPCRRGVAGHGSCP
jgi:hypothetical protein